MSLRCTRVCSDLALGGCSVKSREVDGSRIVCLFENKSRVDLHQIPFEERIISQYLLSMKILGKYSDSLKWADLL